MPEYGFFLTRIFPYLYRNIRVRENPYYGIFCSDCKILITKYFQQSTEDSIGVLEPRLLIYDGKPSHPSNYEFYPWLYANQSGWMDLDTFYKWFQDWEKQTCQYQEFCILIPGTLELVAKSSCG